MKYNDSNTPVEYQIDQIQAKGKRALYKMVFTIPFAIGGLVFAFIISILDDDVAGIILFFPTVPLLVNIAYVTYCYMKAKKLENNNQ